MLVWVCEHIIDISQYFWCNYLFISLECIYARWFEETFELGANRFVRRVIQLLGANTLLGYSIKGMLARRPNSNDVDNTDTSNSELKVKVTKTTFCIVLLYRYRTHTIAQIFIECSRINYVSKSNCKNSILFICVISMSGISNFVVINCTVSISSIYCHELTAWDIFRLRKDNKYLI